MGLKVHGMPLSTNTVRVLAAINEKGLPYDLSLVDLRTGAHKHPDFLALNPFGQIPVLEDGDLVLSQSRAINRHIACKYKEDGADLLPPAVSPSLVEVWLEVESQQFEPAVSALVFELLFKPLLVGAAADEAVVTREAARLGKVLDVYEAHLAKGEEYLAGEVFTLADLNHMPYTFYLLKSARADLITSRPHVLAWWNRISARPAWQKTAAAISLP